MAISAAALNWPSPPTTIWNWWACSPAATRATVHPLGENVAVWPATELAAHTDDIDVLMLAGGSATDLPEQTPAAAALYNVVDSFDTHANIPAHFAAVDAVARETGHVAVISVGWDPGMFSVSRVYANGHHAQRRRLHLLGPRRLPGALRRHPPHPRAWWTPASTRCPCPSAGGRALRCQPGADHASEAHPRVLRRGRRGCRYGCHRRGHRHDAELLRRLRHHGHLHFSGRARPAITPAFPTAARSSALAPRVPPARTPT